MTIRFTAILIAALPLSCFGGIAITPNKQHQADQFQFAVRPSVSFLIAGQALVKWESTHQAHQTHQVKF